MPVDSDRPARALAVLGPADPGDPHWRFLLESRWRARLLEVTELSLAYHDAAAAPVTDHAPDGARDSTGEGSVRQLRGLLNRAVTARRALADTEEALVRLAAGHFGRCEHCTGPIPPARLAGEPEARYCPRCAPVA